MDTGESGMREAFEEYRIDNFDIYCTWGGWQAACKWQRKKDVEICEEVSAMMAKRPCEDYAAGGKAAANHCANFIVLGYVIKD